MGFPAAPVEKLGESVGVPNTVAAVPITAPGALAKKALVDRIM